MSIVDQVCDVLASIASQVDSPRARAIGMMARYREWEQLQQLDPVAPSDYDDSESYAQDAILTDFARKSPPVKGDLHDTAVSAFFSCEAECYRTNARLARYINNQGPFRDSSDIAVADFIERWKKDIGRVLKSLPASLEMRFSPGATVGSQGSKITIPDKIESVPTYYTHSECMRPFVDKCAWGRVHWEVRTTPANKFFSVPKDAKKNRGCCKEASGNVVLQLAAGAIIRQKLKRFGCDLDRGQDHHREMAAMASVTQSHATIDLSNASDTVSKTLVRLILPDQWYTLLTTLRATHTDVGGKLHRLEKFSSMGNGFTFELESLIFLTLAWQFFEPSDVSVYGDDIIVPSEGDLKGFLSALSFFGFTPNKRKTFLAGNFRESCGGDFYKGVAVRPYYLKKYPEGPQDWIAIHNGLVRLSRPHLTHVARNICLQMIPSNVRRCAGPTHLGDQVLHRPFKHWATKPDENGWDGIWVRVFRPLPRILPMHHWPPHIVLASALYGVPSQGVSPRGHVRGHKVAWQFVARRHWDDWVIPGVPC